jgi:hypothetical protein
LGTRGNWNITFSYLNKIEGLDAVTQQLWKPPRTNALYEHYQTEIYALFIHEKNLNSIALFNIFLLIALK